MLGKGEFKDHIRYINVAGCFLINCPFGIVWYYGNLSTYVTSYLLYRIEPTAFNIQPEWLLSTYIFCYVLGVLTVDWLTGKFPSWLVELTALVIFNLVTFLTYFAVQHSIAMVLITFMVCTGYTIGIVGMITLINARKVMPKHVGLVTSVVNSAFGLGAIANNYVITAYINPHNLTPDVRQSKMAYFSQVDVLSDVPGVFVITGLISSAFHFLGYLLEQLSLLYLNRIANKQYSTFSGQRSKSGGEENNIIDANNAKRDMVVEQNCSESDIENGSSLKPTEVLRERSLQLLWLSMAALTYGIIFTQNFYKLFGQLWIKDDVFLTSVGSFVAISSGVCKLLIGFAIDKIGVKRSLILVTSVNSILFMFWYITPIWNRWLYFFCCQVLTGFQGTAYVLFPLAALKLYGPTYYASNFGLILGAQVVADLVSPVIFSYLQDEYGWFSMVLVGSVLSTVALVSVVFLMPEDRSTSK